MSVVGQPLPHDSARGHVTGQAPYVDDLRPAEGELHVDFVGSPVAHGRLRRVDVSAARQVAGVEGVFTAADVAGKNHFGPIFNDEIFLVPEGGECGHIGQPIVVIAACDRRALHAARHAVKFEIEPLKPILTIDEALEAHSFLGVPRQIQRGHVTDAFAHAELVLEGQFVSGGQEQFYLESQSSIAYPEENDHLTIVSSTQNPTETQMVVAEVLGLGMHQVVCVCRRMGGGFGGKETQAVHPALAVALVAQKLRRPARIVYSKDDDMRVTGKRHPYQNQYKVAFTADGTITALRVDYLSNGGWTADLSTAVLERTMLHTDNAYYIPNIEINGRVCKTNLPSNTAFRGFGGPQGVAMVESIIEDIAQHLGLDPLDVRRRNLYGEGERNVTPYGQVIEHNTLPALLDQLEARCAYRARRDAIERFNATSPTHLRGLGLTPVKFGISFTNKAHNQGSALVSVYTDGTVQVSTGGTEMGQGLNVKIRQLVADELGIGPEKVVVMPTSTEKNINTSPTAASAGTDLNGTAAVRAAAEVRRRMAECFAHIHAKPDEGYDASPTHVVFENGEVYDRRRPGERMGFGALALVARRERYDLGARGFYATPGVNFNRETGRGTPFLYFTNGVAATEVLIDRFTGELRLARVDLLMDIGRSINSGVDRGQIIGGFIQGVGWCTAEELKYSDKGELLSFSPTTYKIPGINDLPAVFNLDLLENDTTVLNVARSKAVGEPPLLLGVSAWAAVKHALGCVAGPGRLAPLSLPATNEEILMRLTALLAERDSARPPGPVEAASVALPS